MFEKGYDANRLLPAKYFANKNLGKLTGEDKHLYQ